ncbi:MAG TPA: histidinol dehydrogenase, partial [Thermoanaerobaculia bacterium]|nr:histidinol dehydrogenase [Thermoanaerobaculia bacterium]
AATPEVFGDYVAGPSHVLPTCGSARFASALGVEDFLRRSHRVRFSPAAAARWAEAAACLAAAEGLPAHAAAALLRGSPAAGGGAGGGSGGAGGGDGRGGTGLRRLRRLRRLPSPRRTPLS